LAPDVKEIKYSRCPIFDSHFLLVKESAEFSIFLFIRSIEQAVMNTVVCCLSTGVKEKAISLIA